MYNTICGFVCIIKLQLLSYKSILNGLLECSNFKQYSQNATKGIEEKFVTQYRYLSHNENQNLKTNKLFYSFRNLPVQWSLETSFYLIKAILRGVFDQRILHREGGAKMPTLFNF